MSLWARSPCVACGEPVAPDEDRCPHCGARQAPEGEPRPREWAAPEDTDAARSGVPDGAGASDGAPEDAAAARGGALGAAGAGTAGGAGATRGGAAPALAGEAAVAAMIVALLAAFGAAVVLLGAAVLITAFPFHHSIIQFHGSGLAFGPRVLLALGQLVQAPFDARSPELGIDTAVQATPLVSLILPIGTIAVITRVLSGTLAGVPPVVRLAWGAATGVPFTLIMVLLALASRTSIVTVNFTESFRVAPGTVFGLGLLWGALGGTIGAWWSIPAADRPRPRLPGPLTAAVKHFALALALSTAIMTAVVAVQTGRDAAGVQSGRGAAAAIAENSTFALEHGIHGLQLGLLGEFKRPQGALDFLAPKEVGLVLPVPTARFLTVFRDDGYRLTSFKDALSGFAYLCALIGLLGVPAVLCVRGGWAAARARGAGPLEQHLLAGAVLGPVWAVALTALAALADKSEAAPYFGLSDLGGTFVAAFLIATTLGALGGASARPAELAVTS